MRASRRQRLWVCWLAIVAILATPLALPLCSALAVGLEVGAVDGAMICKSGTPGEAPGQHPAKHDASDCMVCCVLASALLWAPAPPGVQVPDFVLSHAALIPGSAMPPRAARIGSLGSRAPPTV